MYYDHAGRIVTNLSKICCHYMKTWFVIDIITVIPAALWNAMFGLDDSGPSVNKASCVARIARLGRLGKLLRLLRMRRFLAMCAMGGKAIGTGDSRVWTLFKFFFMLSLVIHLMASGVYLGGLVDDTWLSRWI